MALGNGQSIDDMGVPPNETATFRIGGRDLVVPALTLWDLEQSSDLIRGLTADMPWPEYATRVVRIISRKLNEDNPLAFGDALLKSCSVKEGQGLAVAFGRLLSVSGFDDAPGEAEAASPGTGTSTELPPNSPSPSETQT